MTILPNRPRTQIVMRIPLDRPPTDVDRQGAVGLELFQERLLEAGWVDSDGKVLQPFHVSFRGYEEDGVFYIEWKAVLVATTTTPGSTPDPGSIGA